MKHVLLMLLLALALSACTATSKDPAQAPPPTDATRTAATGAALDAKALGANHWRLSEAHDAKGQPLDALMLRADRPVQLDFAEGRVGVSNTCNRMGGAYSIKGNQLDFSRFASTLMACADPGLAALDQEVGKRLQGTVTAALADADTLTLTTPAGDVLRFKGEPTAETRYGGRGEQVFMEVAAQTKPCSHGVMRDAQCLQVREIKYDDKGLKVGTPGAFENFYGDIEGYTHEAGIRNVLRLKRYTIANPPADGSSLAYVLDMVVESENTRP